MNCKPKELSPRVKWCSSGLQLFFHFDDFAPVQIIPVAEFQADY